MQELYDYSAKALSRLGKGNRQKKRRARHPCLSLISLKF